MKNSGDYFISSGRLGKMFTLRQTQTVYSFNGSMYQKDVFIQTLSNDYEKALEKATAICGKSGFGIEVNTVEDIADRTAKDYGTMPNGKYVNLPFEEVDVSYLAWWYSNYVNVRSYAKTIERLEPYLVDAGELVKRAGEYFTKEDLHLAQKQKEAEQRKAEILTARKAQKYYGKPYDLVEATVVCQNVTSFNGHYGVCHVYTFTDGAHTFVYMGSYIDIERGEYFGVVEGEEYTIAAKVKAHKNYNDLKQTLVYKPSLK